MARPYPPIHYSDYLKVHEITDLQKPKSAEFGKEAHDEMLFIIIHQVYELWFKQILFELDSILAVFSKGVLEDHEMLTANSRMQRIVEIQKLLIDQVGIIETMTPLDFLDFRDFIYPASGFQSAQFRLIENKLGLKNRLTYNNQPYKEALKKEDQKTAQDSEESPSLFELLEGWLERTPFLSSENFNFWQTFRDTVTKRINDSRQHIKDSDLDENSKDIHLKGLDFNERSFHSIFEPEEYEKLKQEGHWRLSHQALQAALFIQLYRDEPALQLPFHLLTLLQNIDENFTQWRHRHALMAHRMLGAKMGTGGSSGHKYLRAASDKHKVFQDFFNLATFFIPRSDLPELPSEVRKKLKFNYS